MRLPALLLIAVGFLLILENVSADRKKRREQNDLENINENKISSKKQKYNKYDKIYSDEMNGDESSEPDEDSDSIHSTRKEKKQKKKTLGALFEEKSQKKKEKKEKFKKNVLKHLNLNDDSNQKSSEEIVAPLRKVKLQGTEDCDSSEEECMK